MTNCFGMGDAGLLSFEMLFYFSSKSKSKSKISLIPPGIEDNDLKLKGLLKQINCM